METRRKKKMALKVRSPSEAAAVAARAGAVQLDIPLLT